MEPTERRPTFDVKRILKAFLIEVCCSPSDPIPPITTSGSGRSHLRMVKAANKKSKPEMTYGPASSGTPKTFPSFFAGPNPREGPSTEPIVDAQTKLPIAEALFSSGAKSAAAKRAAKFAPLPTPTPRMPSGKNM